MIDITQLLKIMHAASDHGRLSLVMHNPIEYSNIPKSVSLNPDVRFTLKMLKISAPLTDEDFLFEMTKHLYWVIISPYVF